MSQIYFTSDTHFAHNNIAGKNTSRWNEGYRDYSSLEEMNQDLVKAINQTVGANDTLYHLGDWSFGGAENIWRFRKQILCKNIHLILGNHDHHIEENIILPNVHYGPYNMELVEGSNPYINPHNGQRDIISDVRAKALFKSVSHYKEIMIGKIPFILSHYGHRVWHGSHKGWIHLYGHSHGSLPAYGKSMDVGVDVAISRLKSPRPFSATEILDIMDKRSLEFPDHHDLSTNTGKPQGASRRR